MDLRHEKRIDSGSVTAYKRFASGYKQQKYTEQIQHATIEEVQCITGDDISLLYDTRIYYSQVALKTTLCIGSVTNRKLVSENTIYMSSTVNSLSDKDNPGLHVSFLAHK